MSADCVCRIFRPSRAVTVDISTGEYFEAFFFSNSLDVAWNQIVINKIPTSFE